MTIDLDTIRARADGATPGPWRAHTTYPHTVWQGSDDDPYIISTTLAREVVADAEFIAHARTDVPALIAEVEQLRAQLAAERGSGQPTGDGPTKHVLAVTEPGVWTLRHPPTCAMDCPMFALMHTAMTTADLPVGTYEVHPNGLWDRALISDRIGDDGPLDYLIWSHHHNAWWGRNRSGYRSNPADAGRYTLVAAQAEMGRGCYCCPAPEVPVAAGKAIGASSQAVLDAITQATERAIQAGQGNRCYDPAEAVAR